MKRPEGLVLYQFATCPFCQRVHRAAEALGLDLAMRDVQTDPAARDELARATGRTTVPCLRIEEPGGAVRWMHESLDIVDYLEQRFA